MQKYKTLEEFMDGIGADKRPQVDALRNLILKTDPH
jgi:hypothetical protein